MHSVHKNSECPRRAGAESPADGRAGRATPARRKRATGEHDVHDSALPRLLSTGTLALAVVSTAVLLLAGCASPGPQGAPQMRATAAQVGLPDDQHTTTVDAQWWHQYGDAQLDDLVARALAGSPSLAAASARVASAQAAVAARRGGYAPQVGGDASVSRQRLTESGLYPPPYAGSVFNTANAQLDFSWDIDLFRRQEHDIAAALGAERAAQADAAVAAQGLAAQVVRGYLTLARLGSQKQVAERTLAQRDELLRLVRQRVAAGLDTVVELRNSEGAIPDTRAQIEALDEQIDLARHVLAALTVQAPQSLGGLSPTLGQLRIAQQPTVLGADLLARRPEIAAALARVEAASEQVALQKTRFYPDINLTGFFGFNSIGLSNFADWGSRNWDFGPAIHLPIFEGGTLRAQLKGKAADRDAAIDAYNQAVVDAVHEAADAATSAASVGRQHEEQRAALESARSAYEFAQQRYAQGLGNQLIVLNAETQWLSQQRLDVDLQYRTLDVQAQLMKSLGGGWNAASASAAPAPGAASTPAA
jgi:NodT family efflux transporter outer membrane factor (OMF) lipoprotein